MATPMFATSPGHVVVELTSSATATPSNVMMAAPPGVAGTPVHGLGLPGGGGLQFRPLFRIASPIAAMAHTFAPASFALPAAAAVHAAAAPLARFMIANVPHGVDTGPILDQLRKADYVETAYFAPAAVPAMWEAPPLLDTPATTPNYVSLQGYLAPAPGGIDAVYAATQPGGNGNGVTICDIEGGWVLNHEDVTAAGIRLVLGTNSTDPNWLHHGTAVIGEMLAVPNGQGCQGIAHAARGLVASISPGSPDSNPADTIRAAADALQPGDVLLIELHRPGPRSTALGQFGYLPMEFWRAEFVAIQYAIDVRGVVVVEAAGNGSQNLDDTLYDPATGQEPQRRDSGAIMVGAGAPPDGLFGPDRSRLDFSNYGRRVDCQGWGQSVVTLAYGDLHSGTPQQQYTARFNGTSSASPIVAAACACVQGHARAKGTVLTCPNLREMLRATGSPQTDGPNGTAAQRIGTRPNLRALFALV